MCKLCVARGKTWKGDDPKCAFNKNGGLLTTNWNCATLNFFRAMASTRDFDDYEKEGLKISCYICSDDESGMMISYQGMFIFLQWYKNRGSTNFIKLFNNCRESDELGLEYIIDIIKNITCFRKSEEGTQ